MEYKITKKDYRNLLLKNSALISSLFALVLILNITSLFTTKPKGVSRIFEYITIILLAMVLVVDFVSTLYWAKKEFAKGSNESTFTIQKDSDKYVYENLSTGKKIEFSINDILDIRLFKKLGLIQIKQGKIGARIAVEVNDFSRQLKNEFQEFKKLKAENKKKEKQLAKQNKNNKGE